MVFFCFIEQVSCFFEIMLYLCDNFKTNGALAHLARALTGSQKVAGSSPVCSTKKAFMIFTHLKEEIYGIFPF